MAEPSLPKIVQRRFAHDHGVTVNGRAVAELVPVQQGRRAWIGRADLVARLARAQADPGLRADLAELAGDSTDDLGPIR